MPRAAWLTRRRTWLSPPSGSEHSEQRGLLGLGFGRFDQFGAVVADAVDQSRYLADLDAVEVAVATQQALVDRSVRIEPAIPVFAADGQRHPVVDVGQRASGIGGDDRATQQRRRRIVAGPPRG